MADSGYISNAYHELLRYGTRRRNRARTLSNKAKGPPVAGNLVVSRPTSSYLLKQDCDETDLEISTLRPAHLRVCRRDFSLQSLAAQFLQLASPPLLSGTSKAPTSDQISSAERAAAIAPFRSDLKADYAAALTGQTLKSEYAGKPKATSAQRMPCRAH